MYKKGLIFYGIIILGLSVLWAGCEKKPIKSDTKPKHSNYKTKWSNK